MARMQSLEEETLLKGTLSSQAGTASSSIIGAFGGGGRGGVKAGSGAGVGAANQRGGDGDEPQTDEEEEYSDQVYKRNRSTTRRLRKRKNRGNSQPHNRGVSYLILQKNTMQYPLR